MSSSLRNLVGHDTKVITSHPSSSSTKRSLLTPQSDEPEPFTAPSLPSSVHLVFPTPLVGATHLALTFQGGFAATTAMVYVALRPHGEQSRIELGLMIGGRIYPEDKNKRQVFEIPFPPNSDHPPAELAAARAELPRASLGDTNGTRESTSNGHSGPTVVTEVPANPGGGGAPAAPFIPRDRDALGQWAKPDITEIKVEFEKASDGYGRVTLYSIEVLGPSGVV